jgi:hypothetical protein
MSRAAPARAVVPTLPVVPTAPVHWSLGEGLRADGARALAMAAGGALAFAPVEYALTLWTYAGAAPVGAKLRLVALTATLALVLWLALWLALGAALALHRLVGSRLDPAAAGAPGLGALAPLVRAGDELGRGAAIRAGVPRLWGAVVAAVAMGAALQRAAAWALTTFKEPQLTAGLIALLGLGAAALLRPLARVIALGARAGAIALRRLGPVNPLGRWRAAGFALAGLAGAALAAVWIAVPASRSVLPVRLAISALAVGLGMGLGARWAHERRRVGLARRPAAARAAAGGALVVATLVAWGADLQTKYMAITASPALERLIALVRVANDLDRDGFGSLLGEGDCAPLRADIYPGARDLPGDGIDQSCDGRDFSLSAVAPPADAALAVPPAFRRDWSVLLLTIDTVRYDRTSFGGYRDGPQRRDTTPRLAELVAESTSFAFAQAPSAGTMASIPAILTSRYFHSGISLDEAVPRGTPPRLRPENTTLPELMQRAGLRTGAIGSHEWWTGWGIDQGVDDFDNAIGAKPDPYRVAADRVTDRALAWISRHQGQRWFLWAHYIDPHGRYVAHPSVVDYGSSEPDLYDAELRWTDREVGRLLDELRRLPSHASTIIVITSDHGESMGEHGIPLGTHGTALYRELLHVPLIFYVPDLPPRVVRGAVTSLDITPTLAAILELPAGELRFEGRSLVGELFHGREDRDRVVFAETNAPHKQRAAISERWKLIHYLSSNLYELYDLAADPQERTNLAPQQPAALAPMKQALEGWMERTLYARDPVFNQAYGKVLGDVVLRGPPALDTAVAGHTLAGGSIEVLGAARDGAQPLVAGAKIEIAVYLRARRAPGVGYRFQLVAWAAAAGAPPTDPVPPAAARTAARITAEGAYPSNRWQPGEVIRERFSVVAPAGVGAGGLALGLALGATDLTSGAPASPTGPAPSNEPQLMALGQLSAPAAGDAAAGSARAPR